MNLGILENSIKRQTVGYEEGLNLLSSYKWDEESGAIGVDEKSNYDAIHYSTIVGVEGIKNKAIEQINTGGPSKSYTETIPSDEFLSEGVFSLCSWFYPVNIPVGNYSARAINIFSGTSTSVIFLGFDNSNKVQYFTGSDRVEFGTANLNEWIHLGVAYDGAKAYLYLNGNLITEVTHTLLAGFTKKIQVGRYESGMLGKYDETKFSKSIWTSEQFSSIYQNEL